MSQSVMICGLGPGTKGSITQETMDLLLKSPRVFLRTAVHPGVEDLVAKGMEYTSFDALYEQGEDFESVYEGIVSELINAAQKEEIVYAVPGNPMCGESTVQKLISSCKEKHIPYKVLPAMSFLDSCLSAVEFDPINGLMVLDALSLGDQRPDPHSGVLVTQVYNGHVAGETKLMLSEIYSDETQVALITADALSGEEKVTWMPLYQIDRRPEVNHLTSLFIPPQPEDYRNLPALEKILGSLRAPGGCPWDRAQTHETLRTYLLEETYEAIDAIDNEDLDNLIEELGDLLMQIVFHAQIGREKGYFNMGDILQGICEKMIRRHPHVFGEAIANSPAEVNRLWEQVKKAEKGEKLQSSAMDEIPKAFPALVRAHKIQAKARKDGFDWDDAKTAFPKIAEETAEIQEAMESGDHEHLTEELGDLLFATVNVARLAGIDSELALKGACDKFVARYAGMEALAAAEGKSLKDFSLDEQENFWVKVKKEQCCK